MKFNFVQHSLCDRIQILVLNLEHYHHHSYQYHSDRELTFKWKTIKLCVCVCVCFICNLLNNMQCIWMPVTTPPHTHSFKLNNIIQYLFFNRDISPLKLCLKFNSKHVCISGCVQIEHTFRAKFRLFHCVQNHLQMCGLTKNNGIRTQETLRFAQALLQINFKQETETQ